MEFICRLALKGSICVFGNLEAITDGTQKNYISAENNTHSCFSNGMLTNNDIISALQRKLSIRTNRGVRSNRKVFTGDILLFRTSRMIATLPRVRFDAELMHASARFYGVGATELPLGCCRVMPSTGCRWNLNFCFRTIRLFPCIHHHFCQCSEWPVGILPYTWLCKNSAEASCAAA